MYDPKYTHAHARRLTLLQHQQLDYALPGTIAEAEATLSAPPEKDVLRSWLPPQQLRREVTELLPDNLVPMLDPCLAKFYLSPIEVADKNYCVYFDNAEFQVRVCVGPRECMCMQ